MIIDYLKLLLAEGDESDQELGDEVYPLPFFR